MTTRECVNCGESRVLSVAGMRRIYQGTPSWSDLKALHDRVSNNPHKDRVCLECETAQ